MDNKEKIIRLYNNGVSQNDLVSKYNFVLSEINKVLGDYTGLYTGRERLNYNRQIEVNKKHSKILGIFNSTFKHIDQIAEECGVPTIYVRRLTENVTREYRPDINKIPSFMETKVGSKKESYYEKEMQYQTGFRPTYTFKEVESEYIFINKPPTMFGACERVGKQKTKFI